MLTPGTKLGCYEVVGLLGAGGMGEVYRARDMKLHRDVALKVLPDAFFRDGDRLARFQREAQLLASLNHPHIGAIYAFQDGAPVHALVLELVEGPTLADRIAQGAVPLEEALRIARSIADALEAAHEQGIIHRDLKPANIKLRPDGAVKVLDFGLAKVREPLPPGAGDAALSPTLTSPTLTQLGVILGTAAYMSPEQARGHPVDRGADIWAFGCVLFEMLTGSKPFAGADTTDVIAAIVRAEPDWSQLPRDTPDSIRRLLRRCLVKDRNGRLAHIRDARLEIDDAQHPESGAPLVPVRPLWRDRLLWSLGILVLGLAGLIVFLWRSSPPDTAPQAFPMRLEITTPPTTDPVSLAISPDGRHLAFVALASGRPHVWVRSLETGGQRPLAGSEGASFPFWSPDSRSVAFFTNERLYRAEIDGGPPRVIASAPVAAGGTWSRNGTIIFPPVPDAPLFHVSQDGGLAQPAGPGRRGMPGQRSPHVLPDGERYLYYERETRGVFLSRLGDSTTRRLFDADAAAVIAPPDHVLFVRDRTLF